MGAIIESHNLESMLGTREDNLHPTALDDYDFGAIAHHPLHKCGSHILSKLSFCPNEFRTFAQQICRYSLEKHSSVAEPNNTYDIGTRGNG